MLASRVNDDLNRLRERAAEMRASSKELKDNNTAMVIERLAELYDRLANRAETRANSTGSINVASSASAFELSTRFITGQRYR